MKRTNLPFCFFDPKDAEEMLSEMAQVSGPTLDARLYIMSLSRAWQLAQSEAKGTGDGSSTMRWRFVPSGEQVEQARRIDRSMREGIPLFFDASLRLPKFGEYICPLFFDLSDLLEAWNNMKEKGELIPDNPKVTIIDMVSFLLANGGESQWGLVPSRKINKQLPTIMKRGIGKGKFLSKNFR